MPLLASTAAAMSMASLVMLLCSERALAACDQVGLVVTCSGMTINTFQENGVFAIGYEPNQDGLTINVQPTATVSGDNHGIKILGLNSFANNTTLNNYGTITTTGASAFSTGAIIVYGDNATINNYGNIVGTGSFLGDGINVQNQSTTQPTTIVNYGTIIGLSGINHLYGQSGIMNVTNSGVIRATGANGDPSVAIGGFSNSILTNNSGGVIDGPLQFFGSGTTVTNRGLMTTTSANIAVGAQHFIGGSFFQTSTGILALRIASDANDAVVVSGTASLAGTLQANFRPGSYVAKQYTLLTAGTGISGAFETLVNTSLPPNFVSNLSYDANEVYLDLSLDYSKLPGLNGNQRNVGSALTKFFDNNGTIPFVLGSLSSVGLTQLSGESATGSQQAAFDAMNQFIGVMTDSFLPGRGDPIGGTSGRMAYADRRLADAPEGSADAFAMFTKTTPVVHFAQRWSVWAAGFGGSQRTDGNQTLGSSTARSTIYGTALGADYRLSQNTLAGFALAGGGTSFNVNGSGYGCSDMFQVGAFVRHDIGPTYFIGALAYGWQDITTDRILSVSGFGHLHAKFNANAWSGRVEGGYRFVVPIAGGAGITPYAAGQFVTFNLPSYIEQAIIGASTFALGYNAKSVTDSRSELGIRADKSFAMQYGSVTLRGRLAWAHDFDPDRNIRATFQTLPGASFVVSGATRAIGSKLTTASVEWNWRNWLAAATFEGEFSKVTNSYVGKGLVRYAW